MNKLADSAVVTASRNQVSCDLFESILIYNIDMRSYHALEGVGGKLWRTIQNPIAFGELLGILAGEYDVAKPQLRKDMVELLGELLEKGLVVIGKAGGE